MLEVELAALDGWSAVGVVPAPTVERVRAIAHAPTPERVAELERETNHDVAAFVDAVAETLGEDGRWFHFGLTSSDVLDTAQSLAVQAAGALVREGLERAFERSSRAQRSIARRSAWGGHTACTPSRRPSG